MFLIMLLRKNEKIYLPKNFNKRNMIAITNNTYIIALLFLKVFQRTKVNKKTPCVFLLSFDWVENKNSDITQNT
ncbi:hypothetical protein JBKA6_0890 [Ichthyobacterium seriolicida]|uniref:Uncharacterized protein n=1 Tax=Ichthyobacterium seriolicida TaxID=242600 RepID=A0A1J1DYD7_9FLAO|nr:hypothetical protein JBKA6_0890 [Ichthyobacterium seriolicida]